MQTFSIGTCDFEGFSFRVNAADSGIVEFHFPRPDGTRVVASFMRNGGLRDVVEVPKPTPDVPPAPRTKAEAKAAREEEPTPKGKSSR